MVQAMLFNVNPYRAVALFGNGIRFPLSFCLLVSAASQRQLRPGLEGSKSSTIGSGPKC
jgi:hypothetical protein